MLSKFDTWLENVHFSVLLLVFHIATYGSIWSSDIGAVLSCAILLDPEVSGLNPTFSKFPPRMNVRHITTKLYLSYRHVKAVTY